MQLTNGSVMHRAGELAYASRVALKIIVVVLALTSLLIPANDVSRVWYPAVMGAPLLWGALHHREDRQFTTWAWYALGFVAFTILRVYVDDWGPPARADYAIHLDQLIGLGALPTLRLQHALYRYGEAHWTDAAALVVYLSYFLAPPTVAVALWLKGGDGFKRYVNALISLMGICLVLHLLAPTAPPWLAALRGEVPHIARILYDVLYHIGPNFYRYGYYVAGGNDVAAMPSLHMGATTLISVIFWRGGSAFRPVAVAYPVAMGLALVYLGEHYIADVLVGVALALVCWKLAGSVSARRSTRSASTAWSM